MNARDLERAEAATEMRFPKEKWFTSGAAWFRRVGYKEGYADALAAQRDPAFAEALLEAAVDTFDAPTAAILEEAAMQAGSDPHNPVPRPVVGEEYFAPVTRGNRDEPIVWGSHFGAVVDIASQAVAVVYSTREKADAALADRTIWEASNAARVEVRRIRYAGGRRFVWADTQEGE